MSDELICYCLASYVAIGFLVSKLIFIIEYKTEDIKKYSDLPDYPYSEARTDISLNGHFWPLAIVVLFCKYVLAPVLTPIVTRLYNIFDIILNKSLVVYASLTLSLVIFTCYKIIMFFNITIPTIRIDF